jgi:hypothetical protein
MVTSIRWTWFFYHHLVRVYKSGCVCLLGQTLLSHTEVTEDCGPEWSVLIWSASVGAVVRWLDYPGGVPFIFRMEPLNHEETGLVLLLLDNRYEYPRSLGRGERKSLTDIHAFLITLLPVHPIGHYVAVIRMSPPQRANKEKKDKC